jgi:hypothetical protein
MPNTREIALLEAYSLPLLACILVQVNECTTFVISVFHGNQGKEKYSEHHGNDT